MRRDIRFWVGMMAAGMLVWCSSGPSAIAQDSGFGGGYPAFVKAQKVIDGKYGIMHLVGKLPILISLRQKLTIGIVQRQRCMFTTQTGKSDFM